MEIHAFDASVATKRLLVSAILVRVNVHIMVEHIRCVNVNCEMLILVLIQFIILLQTVSRVILGIMELVLYVSVLTVISNVRQKFARKG